MDETDLRAELNRTAESDGPPQRINLAAAMTAGRRVRRLRHARTGGGSALGASAVAGVVVAALALHGSPAGQLAAGGAPTATASPLPARGAAAPSRFNPLVPYAAFGTLPAGWHVGQKSSFRGNDLMAMSNATMLYLPVWAPDGSAALTAYPPGQCRSTARTLQCTQLQDVPMQKLGPAPDVNGRPAYWMRVVGAGPGTTLVAWQYAPGAWAILGWGYWDTSAAHPASAGQAIVMSLAAGVRFGQTAPVLFPYTIHSLPGWQITEVDYTMVNGQPSARMLRLAGGHPAGMIQINAVQAGTPLDGPCVRKGKTLDGHASLDGTTVDLFAPAGREACGDDIDGLQVDVIFVQDNGKSRPGAALGYARDLSLLGADQATWQPDPLRP